MAQLLQNDPGFEAFLNQQVGNGTTWGDYMSMPMPDAYALERQYRQQQAAQQAQKQAPVQQPVQDPWTSVGGRNFDPTTGTFKNTGHTFADLDRAIQAQQAVRQQQSQTPVVRQGGTGTVRNGKGAVRNGNGNGTKGGTGTTPPAQPTAPTYDSNWVNGNYGDIVALSKQLAEAERKQQPTEQKTGKPIIAPDGYIEGFDDISGLATNASSRTSKLVFPESPFTRRDALTRSLSNQFGVPGPRFGTEAVTKDTLTSGFIPSTPYTEAFRAAVNAVPAASAIPAQQNTEATIPADGYIENFDDISGLPVRENFSSVAPKNTDYSMGDADDSDVSSETAARNLLASGFVPTTPLGEIQAEQSILPKRIRQNIGKRNSTSGTGFKDETQARQRYQEALKLAKEGKLKGAGPLGSDISAEDFTLLSPAGKAFILSNIGLNNINSLNMLSKYLGFK